MSKIYHSIQELVGHTPLFALDNIKCSHGLRANLIAKLELYNPTGSVKDRAAFKMICDAEMRGRLREGYVIIEPTSGNTGIGLAALGGVMGYRVIIVMPDSMSVERIQLIKAYGAEVVLTPGAAGMKGAIARAEELTREIPNSVIMGQFTNYANSDAHRDTTGPEIWDDTDGKVDIFVAGVGTGGTITGTGEYLKSKNPALEIVAVEPEDSAVLSGEPAGAHKLQGIGAGFIPKIMNTDIYDRIARVSTEDAYRAGRELARTEGILAGISSGAALHAAIKEAEKPENEGKNIVVLLPDSGSRYLTTEMYMDSGKDS